MVMQGTDMKVAETPEDLDEFGTEDGYARWQQREGVRVIVDFAFEDLGRIELGPWERKGGTGAIINIPNDHLTNDSHVVEIRPGGKSEPEHHLYEEFCYIISGRGATNIWTDVDHKQTFEWHAGSLFAIPLNAWYQHFNSSSEPARYIAVTNLPPTLRQYHNADFVFNCPFDFTDRFGSSTSDFNGQGKLYQERIWETGFVPDARSLKVYEWRERGGGGSQVRLQLSESSVNAHISQFQVGTYKKAHRHGPGAHLLILEGKGFSLFWQGDSKEWEKVDWKAGTLEVVPYEDCLHQHLNSGATPARYLAILSGTGGGRKYGATRRAHRSDVSLEEGGNQMEYELEDPAVHRLFEEELAANGATCRMKALVPWCTGEVGPTNAGEWGDG
ncbi:MAG: cupin domain-containing protein [Myxococcales bacterium]|nr:cupin domain-containing protein [Myxococcales bacterium]